MQVDANQSHMLDVVRFPESRAAHQVQAATSAYENDGDGDDRVGGTRRAADSQASEPVRSDPGPDAGRNVDISA